jgi:hypothetical protein
MRGGNAGGLSFGQAPKAQGIPQFFAKPFNITVKKGLPLCRTGFAIYAKGKRKKIAVITLGLAKRYMDID